MVAHARALVAQTAHTPPMFKVGLASTGEGGQRASRVDGLGVVVVRPLVAACNRGLGSCAQADKNNLSRISDVRADHPRRHCAFFRNDYKELMCLAFLMHSNGIYQAE